MRNLVLIVVSVLLMGVSCTKSRSEQMNSSNAASDSVKWSIVIHGGAGVIDKSIPDSVKQVYLGALNRALQIGTTMLKNGDHGLDVVEKVINSLENDPHFNAGKGAVYTHAGTHEMDAAIMDGSNLQAGAVAGVKHVKNPISAARLVMEKTPHVLLSGDGADQFAREQGLQMEPQSYFDTEHRRKQWEQVRDKESFNQDLKKDPATYFDEHKFGTVGCVVFDTYGNLTAGTSTGGLTDKKHGRIGDSPIIGAGTYANNKTCAISSTGIGELFMRHVVSYDISAMMEYKGMTLQEAASKEIHKKLQPGDGGVIGVSHDGSVVMEFNTQGMFRATANSNGRKEVKIWE